MKHAIAILAAGLLSMSAAAQAQTVIQQNQGRVAPLQSGTNLSPGNISAGQPQIAGVALPQLPANLQNPMAASQASADIFAFMALFQKLAQEQRQGARESRDAAREAQYAALTDAAERMKQAAAANMQQAQVTGAMAIASGAMSAGMAGAGAQTKPATQGKTMTGTQQGKTAAAASPLQAPTKALTMQEKNSRRWARWAAPSRASPPIWRRPKSTRRKRRLQLPTRRSRSRPKRNRPRRSR